MNCHLCGQPKASPDTVFCAACARKLIAGLHPVVCAGCRKAFGILYGVQWVDRGLLHDRLNKALQDLQRRTRGVATFVRKDCETCRAVYYNQEAQLTQKTRGMN